MVRVANEAYVQEADVSGIRHHGGGESGSGKRDVRKLVQHVSPESGRVTTVPLTRPRTLATSGRTSASARTAMGNRMSAVVNAQAAAGRRPRSPRAASTATTSTAASRPAHAPREPMRTRAAMVGRARIVCATSRTFSRRRKPRMTAAIVNGRRTARALAPTFCVNGPREREPGDGDRGCDHGRKEGDQMLRGPICGPGRDREA